MRSLALALAVLLVSGRAARAGFTNSDIGSSGGQFLKLGAGARAEGMGEAYAAAADDADAIYWNPAALSRIETHSATFMHAALLGAVNYEFLGYGQKLGRWGGIGSSLQFVSQPAVTETDSSGFTTGNSFHPSDFAAALGYAYTVPYDGPMKGLNFGLTVKYVQSTLSRTASTYGVDLGFLSDAIKFWGTDLRVAYVVQNLGGTLKFQQVGDPLPLNLRLGTAWTLTENWLFAFDVNEPQDNSPYFSFGGEYRHAVNAQTSLSLRLGANTLSWGGVSNLNGATLGLGGRFQNWGIDYAFAPMGSLGMNHRVSLKLSF